MYSLLTFAGADRVMSIIEDMTGQKPSIYFKLCWKYIIPLLSLVDKKDCYRKQIKNVCVQSETNSPQSCKRGAKC